MDESDKMPQARKSLVDHFSRSISAFQASTDRFRVINTLPWSQNNNPSSNNSSINGDGAAFSHGLEAPGRKTKELVVLDSSFNPPTKAHAAMLRSALASTRVSTNESDKDTRVLLLLAVKNADKAPQPAAFHQRLGMMLRFGSELGEWEEARNVSVDIGVTTEPYFHDKAQAIRDSGFYGREEQPEHVFLAGFDTLIRIFNPKYYADRGGMQAALAHFFETSRLRVTLRADDAWGSAADQRAWVHSLEEEGEGGIEGRGGRKEWLKRVELVDGLEGEAISSSRVRAAVEMKSDLEGMVGEEVRKWIEEEELYR